MLSMQSFEDACGPGSGYFDLIGIFWSGSGSIFSLKVRLRTLVFSREVSDPIHLDPDPQRCWAGAALAKIGMDS